MGGGEKTRWGCVPNRYSEQENKTETRDNTLKQVCSYSIIMNEEEAWGYMETVYLFEMLNTICLNTVDSDYIKKEKN